MKKLNFEAITRIDEKYAIAASFDSSALFKVDLETGDCEYIKTIPGETINQVRLYTLAVSNGDKIYFIPAAAEEIAVYNNRDMSVEKIPYKFYLKSTLNYKKKANFNGAVKFGKYIFMIPCTFPGVIRIDTETDSIECFTSWMTDEFYVFRKEPTVYNGCFYVPSVINNLVLKFDMNKCEGRLLHIGENNKGCWSMLQDGESMWMAPQEEGPIIKWNFETNDVCEYNDFPEGFCGNGFCFTKVFKCDAGLCFIPAKANMSVVISQKTGKMKKSCIECLEDADLVQYMFEMDDYIYLNITRDGRAETMRLNKKNCQISMMNFNMSLTEKQYYKDLNVFLNEGKSLIKENNRWGLVEFIKSI